jgi:hypothetical protein
MNRVFADAFYFVALLNRADQCHAKATAAARQLIRTDMNNGVQLVSELPVGLNQ